jgi:ribose/xylose/arabinose/galactoside ABC-type transport system permease subunit
MIYKMKNKVEVSKTKQYGILLKRYGTILGYVLICLVFTLATEKFLTFSNIITILRQIVPLSVLSLGLTFVMVVKKSDLSIGYATSILGIVVGASMKDFGLTVGFAVIVTLLCGALIGLANGLAVAYIGVPDFIATLGIGYLLSGLNQAYTKGYSLSGFPTAFDLFGIQRIGGVIPVSLVILFLVFLILQIIISKTKFGRYVYAIGDNAEATMMSGINIKFNILRSYIFSGIGAGIAAVILVSKLGQANPTAGEAYLLDAMAAVYLGATVFKDGEPNLPGTFLGALIIGTVSNGLTLMSMPYYIKDIATGIIIIVAVTVTAIQKMKK